MKTAAFRKLASSFESLPSFGAHPIELDLQVLHFLSLFVLHFCSFLFSAIHFSLK